MILPTSQAYILIQSLHLIHMKEECHLTYIEASPDLSIFLRMSEDTLERTNQLRTVCQLSSKANKDRSSVSQGDLLCNGRPATAKGITPCLDE
jgi:hypothetical protein